MLKESFLVFIGGGAGSVSRYYLSQLVNKTFIHALPLGTMLSNVIASFLVGLLFGILDVKQVFQIPNGRGILVFHKQLWLLLAVGFCGGFSTFSTFSNETLTLIRNGEYSYALLNICLSVVSCLLASFIGFAITKTL